MIKTAPATELIKASVQPSLPLCVLLPGWGSTRDAWRPMVSLLNPFCDCLLVELPYLNSDIPASRLIDKVVDQLAPLVDNNSVIMGWSLGGMLATRIAATNSSLGLVTFASNLSFVQRNSWPNAMSDEVFQTFYTHIERAPLKTLKRFIALQTQGDDLAGELRKLLQACLPILDADNDTAKEQLLTGLTLLQTIDNRECLGANNTCGLHFFGEFDALVPIAVADSITAVNQHHQCHKIAGAGHYLLGSPERLKRKLLDHLGQL